jgi:hypothetical protein
MPLPDFSELTFGYAFLREFERLYTHGGTFPAAPDFISQAAEATLGYDVAVLDGGTPVFFQFKRSFVVRSQRATEFTHSTHFASPPVYRMNLMKKNGYSQHRALRALEGSGEDVLYVTSQVPTPADLSDAFVNQHVVDQATALFSPGDINLPNQTHQHWVSFEANANHGYIFSKEPVYFERKIRSVADLIEKRLNKRRTDAAHNRKRLAAFVDRASENNERAKRIRERFEDPVVQASVIAAYVLDAHLTFFNGPPVKIEIDSV